MRRLTFMPITIIAHAHEKSQSKPSAYTLMITLILHAHDHNYVTADRDEEVPHAF
jgi:hypothetical protein